MVKIDENCLKIENKNLKFAYFFDKILNSVAAFFSTLSNLRAAAVPNNQNHTYGLLSVLI